MAAAAHEPAAPLYLKRPTDHHPGSGSSRNGSLYSVKYSDRDLLVIGSVSFPGQRVGLRHTGA